MLIPQSEKTRGKVIEIHGSPNIGKTKEVLEWLNQEQKLNDILSLYIDTDNKIQESGEFKKLNKSKIWLGFSLDSRALDTVCLMAPYLDVVILDNFTVCKENPWKILSRFQKIARAYSISVIVVNQNRNIINFKTNNFEDKPYFFNAIEQYCDIIIDFDTKRIIEKSAPISDSLIEDLFWGMVS